MRNDLINGIKFEWMNWLGLILFLLLCKFDKKIGRNKEINIKKSREKSLDSCGDIPFGVEFVPNTHFLELFSVVSHILSFKLEEVFLFGLLVWISILFVQELVFCELYHCFEHF